MQTKQQWLALLLEGALARREQEEATHREQEWEEFFAELLEMGQRLRTVAAPPRSGLPGPRVFAELATKWARAPAGEMSTPNAYHSTCQSTKP